MGELEIGAPNLIGAVRPAQISVIHISLSTGSTLKPGIGQIRGTQIRAIDICFREKNPRRSKIGFSYGSGAASISGFDALPKNLDMVAFAIAEVFRSYGASGRYPFLESPEAVCGPDESRIRIRSAFRASGPKIPEVADSIVMKKRAAPCRSRSRLDARHAKRPRAEQTC